MFDISFTGRDVIRSVWAFVAVYLAVGVADLLNVAQDLVASCQAGACDWSTAKGQAIAVALAFIASVLIAIKNLLLKDGSTLKG